MLRELLSNLGFLHFLSALNQILFDELNAVSLDITSTDQDTLQRTQAKVIMRLRRQLFFTEPEDKQEGIECAMQWIQRMDNYSLEEGHNLAGQLLSSSEALGVEHDLGDQLTIGLGHGQIAEELLQIVWEV